MSIESLLEISGSTCNPFISFKVLINISQFESELFVSANLISSITIHVLYIIKVCSKMLRIHGEDVSNKPFIMLSRGISSSSYILNFTFSLRVALWSHHLKYKF